MPDQRIEKLSPARKKHPKTVASHYSAVVADLLK